MLNVASVITFSFPKDNIFYLIHSQQQCKLEKLLNAESCKDFQVNSGSAINVHIQVFIM